MQVITYCGNNNASSLAIGVFSKFPFHGKEYRKNTSNPGATECATKKLARKFTTSVNKNTRYANEDGEVYAICVKFLGGGIILTLGQDSKERHTIIRSKFKSRNQRDNNITPGTWLLIGLRDFQQHKQGKLEKTDLLEVYSDNDKKNLQQNVTNINWNVFKNQENIIFNKTADYNLENTIIWDTEETDDSTNKAILEKIETETDESKGIAEEDFDINFDDI